MTTFTPNLIDCKNSLQGNPVVYYGTHYGIDHVLRALSTEGRLQESIGRLTDLVTEHYTDPYLTSALEKITDAEVYGVAGSSWDVEFDCIFCNMDNGVGGTASFTDPAQDICSCCVCRRIWIGGERPLYRKANGTWLLARNDKPVKWVTHKYGDPKQKPFDAFRIERELYPERFIDDMPSFLTPILHHVEDALRYTREGLMAAAIRKYETARMMETAQPQRDWLGAKIAECHTLGGRV